MDKYAVIGNPIRHSCSPQIHSAFAKQEGTTIDYQRILAAEDKFTLTVNDFFSQGGSGLNITVPFKIQAYQQCVELDEYATAAKAVNTISLNQQGQMIGANTDGIGLLTDLKANLRQTLKQKNILILGAGGATRGIILPLLREHPNQIIIANRTPEKATDLATAFHRAGNISGCGYEQLEQKPYDIIINATSASLENALPPITADTINHDSICYDLAYSNSSTRFIDWAKHHGVTRAYDGIGMLIEQAAAAYYIWRGIKPDTQAVFTLLRPTA